LRGCKNYLMLHSRGSFNITISRLSAPNLLYSSILWSRGVPSIDETPSLKNRSHVSLIISSRTAWELDFHLYHFAASSLALLDSSWRIKLPPRTPW
jgi:hypothetical protein